MADPAPAQPAPPDRLPDWESFYRDYRKPGYVAGFEITSKLGGGAFGLVYRARKESIGKDYAIKFLKVEDDEVRLAVLHELEQVRYFAQIDHPNLVQIEDRGEVDGIPYLVMQYAGSETLRDHLPPDGRMPTAAERDERMRWFLQACRGAAALHERSLVHFDLKPGNVFLKGPVARVGDYGLSKLVTRSRGSLTMGRGTPYYMAPEMLRRRGDHRSDIYSLGVMLYEILCGVPPFTGDSEWEVLNKHENAAPVFPPHLSTSERAAIARCLQKDPAARYQRVEELIAALGAPAGVAAATWDDLRDGSPGAASPPQRPSRSNSPPPAPPPLTPPPRPASASGPEDDEVSPVEGLRDASRQAMKHARTIAGQAIVMAQEFSQKAAAKAQELMQKAQEDHRLRRPMREARRRRRAERKLVRAAARAEARELRRPRVGLAAVALLLAVPVLAGIVLLGLAPRELTLAKATADSFERSSTAAAAAAGTASANAWITYSSGGKGLFTTWSIPGPLLTSVAITEPDWARSWFEDEELAERQLNERLSRIREQASWSAAARGRTIVFPRFECSPAAEHLADLDRLLDGAEYDAAIAARLLDDAPDSLAPAAMRLRGLDFADAGDRERARRLQRLLVEGTGQEGIPLVEGRGLSRQAIRRANDQLGDMWLWYLHEVAITRQSWDVYCRIRRQHPR
ncbi:MAG: serine/threonine protein kinase [Planctomycetes bacterium]|nr:serine/threonine protein kinase [Planctomycetota bacterium]